MAWGRSGGARAPRTGRRPPARRLAWFVVAAVLAAALLFLHAPSPGRAVSPKPPPAPAPSAPAARPSAPPAARPRPAPPCPVRAAQAARPARPAAAPAAPARTWDGAAVVSSACETNRDGAVIERLRLADGRSVRVSRLPEPAFRRPCDQLLAAALSAPPGAGLPPLPLGPDAEASFRATMDEPPEEAREGDSPELRELRARVAEARARIAEAVRAGGSFVAALEEHEAWAAEVAAARRAAGRAASARSGGGAR